MEHSDYTGPFSVREETYENQRWNPVDGFTDRLLPTDRFPFSNEDGTENRDKSLITLPSDKWVWKGNWTIENTFEGQKLEGGWTYATDFPHKYSANKKWKSCVRRRKWFRVRDCLDSNVEVMKNYIQVIKNVRQEFKNHPKEDFMLPICRTLGELKEKMPSEQSQYIVEETRNAILSGAKELFDSIVNKDKSIEVEGETETELEALKRIGYLLINDLRQSHELLAKPFKELPGINFFEITYRFYDEKYGDLVDSYIKYTKRSSFKPLLQELKDENDAGTEVTEVDESISERQSLFQLYLVVKKFADLSTFTSSTMTAKDLKVANGLHTWFRSFLTEWLDVTWFKVTELLPKAVEKNVIRPVVRGEDNSKLKFSSSALDTTAIFQQFYIQNFWNKVRWADVEDEFTMVCRILDDLGRCFIKYAEMVCAENSNENEIIEKGPSSNEDSKNTDDALKNLVLAINNVEYLMEEIETISVKLGINEIMKKLKLEKSEDVAESCGRTLINVKESAVDSLSNQIQHVLRQVGDVVKPDIFRLLLEVTEVDTTQTAENRLIEHLDEILIKLNRKLTPTGFDKAHQVIWRSTLQALGAVIKYNIKRQKRPDFFKRTRSLLSVLQKFFFPTDDSSDAAKTRAVGNDVKQTASKLKKIEDVLELHGASTPELILKYSRRRYEYQMMVKKNEEHEVKEKNKDSQHNGLITIRTVYYQKTETLIIEILNCRHLKMHRDLKSKCDPYVKVELIPRELLPANFKKNSTRIEKDTLFPLFDETFTIHLDADKILDGGLISLDVFNDDKLIFRDEFLGEAFIPLESIHVVMPNESLELHQLPQKHYPLTMPQSPENDIVLDTLKNRVWDRQAVEFAKEEALKLN